MLVVLHRTAISEFEQNPIGRWLMEVGGGEVGLFLLATLHWNSPCLFTAHHAVSIPQPHAVGVVTRSAAPRSLQVDLTKICILADFAIPRVVNEPQAAHEKSPRLSGDGMEH